MKKNILIFVCFVMLIACNTGEGITVNILSPGNFIYPTSNLKLNTPVSLTPTFSLPISKSTTFSIVTGNLPPGLSLNTTTGNISGTVSKFYLKDHDTSLVTIKACNDAGCSSTTINLAMHFGLTHNFRNDVKKTIIGDFEGDSNLELILVYSFGIEIRPIGNNNESELWSSTNGRMISGIGIFPNLSIIDAASGDFDQDGKQDLLVLSFGANTSIAPAIHILKGDILTGLNYTNSISFTGTVSFDSTIRVADINDNSVVGNLDFLVMTYDFSGSTIEVWEGDGNMGFIPISARAVITMPGPIPIVQVSPEDKIGFYLYDIDMDNYPEIIFYESSTGFFYAISGTDFENPPLGDPPHLAIKFGESGITPGDHTNFGIINLNNDQIPDLYLASGDQIAIFRSTGINPATLLPDFSRTILNFSTLTGTSLDHEAIAAYDYDEDGDPDFIVADHLSDSFYLYKNISPIGGTDFEFDKKFTLATERNSFPNRRLETFSGINNLSYIYKGVGLTTSKGYKFLELSY